MLSTRKPTIVVLLGASVALGACEDDGDDFHSQQDEAEIQAERQCDFDGEPSRVAFDRTGTGSDGLYTLEYDDQGTARVAVRGDAYFVDC